MILYQAVCAAFNLGADFVITGTVNQLARQSGSSDYVRSVLSKAAYSDVTMAPAADMFDQGVELQVLKRGTMFPSRAKKLYELFKEYNSLDEIPDKVMRKLEKSTFRQPVSSVWAETKVCIHAFLLFDDLGKIAVVLTLSHLSFVTELLHQSPERPREGSACRT